MTKWGALSVLGAVLMAVAGCEKSAPEGSAATAPPSDAKYLEDGISPEGVAATVFAAKGDSARTKAMDQWANLWIPAPGWIGTVEKLEEKDAGTNVWFSYAAMPQMGGNFWVAVEFPGNTRELREAQDVAFTGRIEKLEMIRPAGTLQLRIVVRNAKILTVNGK